MKASGDFRVVVGAGELVRLDCDAPVRVLCEQGALWITSSAAAEDICLSAGQQVIVPAPALDDGQRVRVAQP